MSGGRPWDPPMPGSGFGALEGASVGGLLTEVLERYLTEWRRLVLVAASIVVPAAVLQGFFTRDVEVTGPAALDPGVTPTDAEIAGMSTLIVVGIVVAVVVTPLLNGLLLRAAAERDTDIHGDLGDLYRTASSYFVPLLALLALTAVAVVVGTLAFVVPGIYLLVRLYLAPAAMIIEGETVGGALVRSWRLTSGAFWRSLGVIGLGLLAVLMLSIALSLPSVLISTLIGPDAWLAQGLLSGLLSAVLWPFLMVLAVVLYLHRRVDVEGYTPMMLAADLAASETRG